MNRHAKASSAGSSTRQGKSLGAVIRGALALALALAAFLGIGAPAAFAAAPAVTIEDASNLTANSADAEGTIDPEGKETSYHFEYATQADFSDATSFGAGTPLAGGAGLTTVDAEATGLQPGTTYHLRLVASNEGGETKVEAASTFTTLAVAPTIKAFAAGPVNSDQATINGTVNPRNAPTTYWFEWGTEDCETSSCQSTAHASAGFNERQRVALDATAGQFTLSFEGQSTPDLAFNASVEAVEAALEALSTIGSGNVAITGSSLHYLVTFTGSLANTDVTQLTAANGTTPLTRNEGSEFGSVEVTEVIRGGYRNGPKHVSQLLGGLSPETTYHFRLIAENAAGTIEGPDGEFTTASPEATSCANQGSREEQHATFLPDCRAYEMVSPTEKNGADVVASSSMTFAAEQGNGASNSVSFPATGGFGDVRGASATVQYLSRRDGAAGTNGWATHAISPPSRAPTPLEVFSENLPQISAMSPDLTSAVFRSGGKGLTDAPNVDGVTNLYRLRDLDASEPQTQLLSASEEPLNPPDIGFQNNFAAASSDFSHIIFQSAWSLTGDGSFISNRGNLYEYADGVGTRAVGRIPTGPDTECDDLVGPLCVDAPSAESGVGVPPELGGQYATEMISVDGSRILFQTPAGAGSGAIYMREDGTKTYQIDGSASAQLWGMSDDGSRVFLTTSAALLGEDTDGGAPDLYMFEVEKPAGSRLSLLSVGNAGVEPAVTHVVGTSTDGHYVYFVSDHQLVAGEPTPVGSGLYLWHDGQISYIGQFDDINLAELNTPRTGFAGPPGQKTSRVSPDGRSLLFMSTRDRGFAGRGGYPGYDYANCVDTQGSGGGVECRELFLYNADTGKLTCVSCNPLSEVATANALINVFNESVAAALTSHLSHALSDDGRRVFFSSKEALVSEDTNGRWDAYSYDVPTGTLQLISSGTSSADSYFMDASTDGSDVFLATRERLVGWDIDSSYDLYDARIEGGFPEPAPVPAPCEGDSCKPGTPPPPGVAPIASQAAGLGNPKPNCSKGKRRVRRAGQVRCVKKNRKAGKQRKANTNRRAGR